jgi:hypothetical protein
MAFDPNQTSNAYLPGEAEWARKSAAAANLAEAERLKNLNLDDNVNSGTPNASAKSPSTVNISTPINSGQKTGKSLVDQNFPGKRKDNPLSYYSSYTYSLTLYMVTPEFANEFTNGPASGALLAKRGGTNQVFVVAQSGGVNTNVDDRAITLSKTLGKNQQGLDYFIDDLTFTAAMPGGPQGQTTASEIYFKIVEPNGFTFLQDLTIASNNLNKISQISKSSTTKPTAAAQHYIISIRYYGYDSSGSLMQSTTDKTNFSDSSAAAERHIPITIRNIKFKLDDKATTYSCEALNSGEQAGFAKSTGIVEQQTSVSGSTVQDVLLGGTGGAVGLLQVINNVNKDKKDKNKIVEIPNEYTIEFIGKNNPIAKSNLLDDKSFDSRTSKMSSVSRTDASNISASFKAVTVNTTARSLSIAAGTPIVQAIDNIIIKSDFITGALTKVNTSAPESKTVTSPPTRPLQWYSINPVVTVKGMDSKTNKWAYKITYQIGTYDVPYARSPYVGSRVKYPGPFKYYGYYLTGENTEILEYEQTYNNLYAITAGKTTNDAEISPTNVKNTNVPLLSQPSTSSPVGGKLFQGSEINESVRASLFSPGDRAQAKIKILGDPDYIMSIIGCNQTAQAIGKTSAESAIKLMHYGADNSINPFTGQVFIQIMFNLTTDYQNNGVMDISDKIQFYDTSAVADSGIKGIVYKVNRVESNFSKGSFTQVLDLSIVEASQLLQDEDKKTVERTTDTTGAGSGTAREGNLTAADQEDADLGAAITNQETISQVQNFEKELPGADDDKITVANKQIQTGGIVEDTAREVFGNESVNAFGTNAGGAAFSFSRKVVRNRQTLAPGQQAEE